MSKQLQKSQVSGFRLPGGGGVLQQQQTKWISTLHLKMINCIVLGAPVPDLLHITEILISNFVLWRVRIFSPKFQYYDFNFERSHPFDSRSEATI